MKAVQLTAINQLSVADVSVPALQEGVVLVHLQAAALNHRDLWIKLGQYAGLKYPVILGSDGAGVIGGFHGAANGFSVGDEIIINPGLNWGANERAQGGAFSILGLPRDGTLAESIAVPTTQLARRPAHLTWSEAAVLPLAGLTAYRAVFARANVQPGERVLISGVGGGVALLAMQFAIAGGATVWVTSSSPEKIERAIAMGASGGFNYREAGWAKRAAEIGGFDVIVDSAGGDGFEALIDLCAPGARVVFFGATRGNPPVLPMRKIFWRQISLLGTTMGSPADWQAMVDFVAANRIRPVVSATFPLADAAAAFDLMERGEQFGKIAITI